MPKRAGNAKVTIQGINDSFYFSLDYDSLINIPQSSAAYESLEVVICIICSFLLRCSTRSMERIAINIGDEGRPIQGPTS